MTDKKLISDMVFGVLLLIAVLVIWLIPLLQASTGMIGKLFFYIKPIPFKLC
jgi:hypothetical protein